MELTNGPNGILGVKPVSILIPVFENGFSFEIFWVKKLQFFYYFALALAILAIIAVNRLHSSRIGRAWESIREDETAAELMGVNTFIYKLLAYATGAFFAGLAGAFFAARMRFVSPESFTFLESAMVLCMVVLGGMGSIPGIILGVFALIVLPEVLRDFQSYRMLIFWCHHDYNDAVQTGWTDPCQTRWKKDLKKRSDAKTCRQNPSLN